MSLDSSFKFIHCSWHFSAIMGFRLWYIYIYINYILTRCFGKAKDNAVYVAMSDLTFSLNCVNLRLRPIYKTHMRALLKWHVSQILTNTDLLSLLRRILCIAWNTFINQISHVKRKWELFRERYNVILANQLRVKWIVYRKDWYVHLE